MGKFRVIHYINQFYGGIGGEDKADHRPEVRDGKVGPGLALSAQFGDEAEIVATIVCGDTYFNENVDEATGIIMEMVKQYNPDIFVAGPAFNAGRYGMACGTISKAVAAELNIPVVTAMYKENPGVDSFKKDVYILETGDSAASMRTAAPALGKFTMKLLKKEAILTPSEEHYFPQGRRVNTFVEERGAKRAVDMLIQKINNQPFTTEYPMPVFDNVAPAAPVVDMKNARVALVTSGGIVPKGNPDRIESSSASKFGKYSIAEFENLTEQSHETAHGGYDPIYANADSDRVLPVDALRALERENVIGKLHEYFYTTVGNGTSVANAKKYAAQIAGELKDSNVQAVILTSTWGTCTRCGATMVKEIERAGIPVVHICTVVPISLTVGANRIVPAVAIPHPLGNPALEPTEEFKLRRQLVERCLDALLTPVDKQTVFDR